MAGANGETTITLLGGRREFCFGMASPSVQLLEPPAVQVLVHYVGSLFPPILVLVLVETAAP